MTDATYAARDRAPQQSFAAPASFRQRVFGATAALGCSAVLGVAAWLTPSASGIGTHEQLPLPPCGWVAVAELPCPTCGMTTSFSHAVRGNLLESFLTQPMGFLLAMATAMTLVMGLHVTVTGSNLFGLLAPIWRPRTLWFAVVLGLAAWAYKIIVYKGFLT